jgi:hypothetical protein
MDKLNLTDYCVVGLGKIDELKEDLRQIAEKNFNVVYGNGLLIGTFKSAFNIWEIEDILKTNNRSYIIFEMNIGFFSASLEDENFQEKLFGSLADRSPFVKMEEQLSKMKDEIFNSVVEKKSDEELLEEAIENEDYETAAKLRDKINNRK